MSKLTQQRLKELLHYNPDTGIFIWRVQLSNRINIGDEAGWITEKGYVKISIFSRHYFAHRLAWLYVYGYFPEHQIDHRDGVKHFNQILNLREATQTCNLQNCKLSSVSKSGFTGVHWHKNRCKWIATITIQGKYIHLGCYSDPISAALARVLFENCSPGWSCDHRQVNRVKLRSMGYKV